LGFGLRPEFAAECRCQSKLVAKEDLAGIELSGFIDIALANVDGWKE
jgi:hypothetical protein